MKHMSKPILGSRWLSIDIENEEEKTHEDVDTNKLVHNATRPFKQSNSQ